MAFSPRLDAAWAAPQRSITCSTEMNGAVALCYFARLPSWFWIMWLMASSACLDAPRPRSQRFCRLIGIPPRVDFSLLHDCSRWTLCALTVGETFCRGPFGVLTLFSALCRFDWFVD